tara:strand:+ start:684 stop:1229 length:546 start_codon:yes stop_codon:yes gene_type:complete
MAGQFESYETCIGKTVQIFAQDKQLMDAWLQEVRDNADRLPAFQVRSQMHERKYQVGLIISAKLIYLKRNGTLKNLPRPSELQIHPAISLDTLLTRDYFKLATETKQEKQGFDSNDHYFLDLYYTQTGLYFPQQSGLRDRKYFRQLRSAFRSLSSLFQAKSRERTLIYASILKRFPTSGSN